MKNLSAFSGLLSLITFFTLFAGCHLSDDKEKIVKITPEFTVDMLEELGSVRQFQFKVASIENQGCLNYTIDINGQRTGNLVALTINDIQPPHECLNGEGPAKAFRTVGFLQNGSYTVHINLKNTIFNQGFLSVSDDAYSIEMTTEDGFETLHSELKRIPAGMIWGYVGYENNQEMGNLADQFISDLKNISTPHGLSTGYYGYFNLQDNRQLVFTPAPSFTYFETFIYRYEGNIKDLEDLLESYRTGPSGNKMEIKITTWEGETL